MTKEQAASELAETIDTVQQCEGVQQKHELEAIILHFLKTTDIDK